MCSSVSWKTFLTDGKAVDVADMRRVVSAEFLVHQVGIDSDLHEHRQRVSATLDKFAEKFRTDAP